MDTLASWLGSITWPLVQRAMAALGFGYVTYEGTSAAIDGAIGAAQSLLAGLPMEVFAIVARFGFFEFMAITSGGIVSGLVWMQLKKLAVQTLGQSA